ncbi:HNH endonuclease [Candidatus Thiothrix phosphatis]|uniref:HNH endonuclease n=1 Tax=Candidatus Thiothrix phosphatis TaxID=3112415 RepID=UPI002D77049F|nr:HNH endonuclease signature motif containing protein [Candidatus Thiothrix sp. Deng01]
MRRRTACQRGYDRQWRGARLEWIKDHPLCASCLAAGKYVPADVVDHITPHRGDKRLFWDEGNWQSLCKPCHDKKTGAGQ